MFLFILYIFFLLSAREQSVIICHIQIESAKLMSTSRVFVKKGKLLLYTKKRNTLHKKRKEKAFWKRKYLFVENDLCGALKKKGSFICTSICMKKSKCDFMIGNTAKKTGIFFSTIHKKPSHNRLFFFLYPFFVNNSSAKYFLWNPRFHFISKNMGKDHHSSGLNNKREDEVGVNGGDCSSKAKERENGFFMSAEDVRNNFINYFHKKDHTIIESSSVVPYNDNTLLFTNAGMNQFKSIFLGNVDKNSDFGKLKRAVDTQKCIRAGGKHNDLDDVGKDVYHHTFFEMLGNWSFGDYFKEESIAYAWDLLTNVYKINPDRLYVTYFGGDKNLPSCKEDIEAKTIWKKYLPENRILPFGLKDNFWEMAETGPCGPCTEVHYDRIGNRDASSLVNKDDPSVLEIWNIVFMQYNKDEGKNLNPLPSPCVDTGMGLERITSIMQNVHSNYDTDIFLPIFKQIRDIFPHLPEYGGNIGEEDVGKIDTAYRVVSDHIRCVTIAIADGCFPSNEGRNYVIRRIIRRAVRFGKQSFNIESNMLWFYKLVDAVCLTLGNTFTELKNEKKVAHIKSTIKQEEMLFNKTLEKGMEQFNKIIKKSTNNFFSGKDAFDLSTTFGFPIDLIEVMCEEKKFQLNMEEYNKLFKKHQLISDTNNFKMTKYFDISVEKAHELIKKYNATPTIDNDKYTWKNTGEKNNFKLEAAVQVIYDGTNFLDSIKCSNEDKKYALILDRTNFYFENGGQIYDTGFIQNEKMKFQVLNVQKMNDFILHIGVLVEGQISLKDQVETIVDFDRRTLIACNHTATHLLNFMIRKVLTESLSSTQGSEKESTLKNASKPEETVDGNECSLVCCEQKGSLVDEEKLRFDFSFFENIKLEQLEKIEKEINELIKKQLGVYVKCIDLAESKKIKGIRSIFEENYANKVNVVSIEKDVDTILNTLEVNYTNLCSIELCGGTHISNTKIIKRFIITSEESIGKGVYRITAVTNKKAEEIKKKFDELYNKYKHVLQAEITESLLPDVLSFKSSLNEDKFLPYLEKKRLLADIERVEKAVIEKTKNIQKELLNRATTIGKTYFFEKKDNEVIDVKFFNEIKGNQKVLEKIVQSYNKNNKCLSLFFIITDDVNTYCVFEVKDSLEGKNIKANEFMKEIMELAKGHSGGSKTKAFGSAPKDKGITVKNLVDSKIKPYL